LASEPETAKILVRWKIPCSLLQGTSKKGELIMSDVDRYISKRKKRDREFAR